MALGLLHPFRMMPGRDDASVRSSREAWVGRLGSEALAFGLLRSLTMIGGVAALFLVPLRPEHRIHLAPLLVGFIGYKAGLLAILARWAERAREVFLATLAADLGLVFLLVWFTGGGESHFYLLFYLLVALNAYYFGPGVGTEAAVLAAGLLALANWLVPPPVPWVHIASRAAVLGLLGLALGHVAARERVARTRAEQLIREMETATGRLVRAEQLAAVGRLSARMAHEVRNPLGAITLNVDMLGDIVRECPGPAMAEAQELLQGIRTEVQALATLTDEYLVAARLPRPRLEKDSLNDLITELVGFLRPVAERQGLRLLLELDHGLPPVAVDRTMLKQAIQNLVKNSLEALDRDGRVTVSTACDAQAALIRVADDGPGIPADAADRLFEPFFTTKPRGTGLGLSIVRQIAREHGGDVTWTSRPGTGAIFTIRLPLEAPRHG
jgi:signal transduction histidine kinase